MGERARIEGGEILDLGSGRRARVEKIERVLADHPLRERRRQREEHPVPGAIGEPRIHAVPHRPGRHDVEHGELFEPARVVEREPISDAAAAVVSGKAKAHITERLHQLDHRRCHGALGVGRVRGVGGRCIGPAVAGQIGNDQAKTRRQRSRHAVPHHVRLRIAVQQKKRRAFAAAAGENPARRRVDPV